MLTLAGPGGIVHVNTVMTMATRLARTMDLDKTLDAVDEAHRSLRLARVQLTDQLDAARRRWMSNNADVFDEVDDDDYPFVEEAMASFFDDGVEDELLPPQHLEQLRASRAHDVQLAYQQCRVTIDTAAKQVTTAYKAFTAALAEWLHRIRAKELEADAWPTIASRWRKALNLTARQAAEALGVSASAIVRYEQGARRPSLAQLAASVEQMVTFDPTAEDARYNKLAKGLAIVWPDRDAFELIDEFESPTHELVGRIEELLPSCDNQQLKLISLVAEDKSIARVFSQLAAELTAEPLLTTLGRVAQLAPGEA